jgi:hypothetical protein
MRKIDIARLDHAAAKEQAALRRGNTTSRAAAIADIERIRRLPNIGMALGNNIFADWIDGWHQEHGAST